MVTEEKGPYFEVLGNRYYLARVEREEFDEIRGDKKRRDLVAYPAYYCRIDDQIELWPTPPQGVRVME